MTQVLSLAEGRALLAKQKPGRKAPNMARGSTSAHKPPMDTPKPPALKEGPTEAQIQQRKDAAQRRQEAELSRLNQQEAPRYQVGTGESTLDTVKLFHLQPADTERLLHFATTELGAKPC